MISKFPGRCDRCGRHVDAGETIRWLSRGKIECSDCINTEIPHETPSDGSTADQWANALSWHIEPSKPVDIVAPTPKPTIQQRIQQQVDKTPVQSLKPGPESDQIYDYTSLPELDVSTTLTLNAMVLVINAIDTLEEDQRLQLLAHSEWYANNANGGSRRYIWRRMSSALTI